MTEHSDGVPSQAHERHAWRVRFYSRLNRIKNLLRSKWWIPMIGIMLGAAGGAAFWHFRTPHYVSFGRMMMSMKLMLPEGSVYTEELSNFLGTQMALMESGGVQNRAQGRVEAQGVNAPAEPVLLKATVLPKTTIFVLQATGSDPQYTQAFLDACMEEYIDLKREMRAQTSESTLAGLTEEVLRLQKDLRKYDEELADFQSSNSIVLLQEPGSSAGNYVSFLNQRLAALKSEYDLLQSLTLDQDLERRQQTGGALPTPDEVMSRSGQYKLDASELDYLKAKQQILLLKADREELEQYLKMKHPKMIALSEEIARRERLLEIFRQQSADQLETRKNSLALQLKNLKSDIADWDSRTLEISRKNAVYQKLKANSQRAQALYDRLLATMQTLDVNKEISPESVTIVEKASLPLPDKPRFARQILLGISAGLGLAAVILLVIDRLDDRMNSFTELQDLFDEDVLAQVPLEKSLAQSQNDSGLVLANDQRHALLEAYRNLRSSILYMGNGQPRPKAFLVTSSVPGEGKSMTAANLALTLSIAGSRVLLVDADLRKGVLHSRLGVAAEPGLSSVLIEGLDSSKALVSTSFPNLSFLPRGPVTPRSSELFVSPATKKFLQNVAPDYDFVILDTAPVMAADDVTSMAPQVDGTVFVVRAEYTSARVARAALDALYQRQAMVLGLVFNAVRPSTGDYHYYNYHDYYASYPTASAGSATDRGK
jgi:polysaccharide biosynthesis transport protein